MLVDELMFVRDEGKLWAPSGAVLALFNAAADWWCAGHLGFVPVTGQSDPFVGKYGDNYVGPAAQEVAFLVRLPAPKPSEGLDKILAFRSEHTKELAELREEIRRLSTVESADELAEASRAFATNAREALAILTQKGWDSRLCLSFLTVVGIEEMKEFWIRAGGDYVDQHHLVLSMTAGTAVAAGTMAVGEVAWKKFRTARDIRSLRRGLLGYLVEARLADLI